MKREKKESVNRVVYFKDTPPKSAIFIVQISKDGIIHLVERIKKEKELISFSPDSFKPNKIYATLKECHKKIGSKNVLYVQMPEWMSNSSPQNTITEFL